ncbi:MAG: U32 family peptidase [Merdibacter sp.]
MSCIRGYAHIDEQELFSMSSKDLRQRPIPALIDAGVSSLKIEGRMKSTYYIATVVHAYRALIDEYMEKGVLDASRIAFMNRRSPRRKIVRHPAGFTAAFRRPADISMA